MAKWQVYEGILVAADGGVRSVPVRASSMPEAKAMIFELLTKPGTPDTMYAEWVRGSREVVCEEPE